MMNDFDKSLELLSNILQIKSYEILINDFNNNDLMKYLQHQDKLLDEIIEQNKEILNLLKGGK
jgi:hypothetical protein